MKINFFKKLWERGYVRSLVQIVILAGVILVFRGIKHESFWGDFYFKIEVPNTILMDTLHFWSVDTLKNERWISVWKYEGDTVIRVRFADFRDDAKISLTNPKYQEENFWWYDLALDFFPSNSGDRWEISLEQEEGIYFIICRRLLITQTYVGGIFALAFVFGFFVCLIWNDIFPKVIREKEKE